MHQPAAIDPVVFLTVNEAATRAGRSTSWVREWVACGQIGAQRLGPRGLLHVDRSDLDALIAVFGRKQRKRPHLRLVINNT